MTDKQIKKEATQAEYNRLYPNMMYPPQDITAYCSDGIWIRKAWTSCNSHGWSNWKKQ